MCRSISGYGLPNGDLLISDVTDSHSEMVLEFGLDDSSLPPKSFPIECRPKNGCNMEDYLKPEEYKIYYRGKRPDWVTKQMLESWRSKFRLYLRDHLVLEDRNALMGGRWIIGKAKVQLLRNCYIPVVAGGTLMNFRSSLLADFRGGTLGHFQDSTLEHFWNGTVKHFWGNKLDDFYNGTIENFWGGRLVDFRRGTLVDFWNGRIEVLHPGATIINWRGGSLGKTRRGATIENDLRG